MLHYVRLGREGHALLNLTKREIAEITGEFVLIENANGIFGAKTEAGQIQLVWRKITPLDYIRVIRPPLSGAELLPGSYWRPDDISD